ncbi:MAG: hypothetical protein WC091_25700 [Sulfuricellaceae bacterium]
MPLWATQSGDMRKGDYDKDSDGIADLPIEALNNLLAAAKAEIHAEIAQTAATNAEAMIQAYLAARGEG